MPNRSIETDSERREYQVSFRWWTCQFQIAHFLASGCRKWPSVVPSSITTHAQVRSRSRRHLRCRGAWRREVPAERVTEERSDQRMDTGRQTAFRTPIPTCLQAISPPKRYYFGSLRVPFLFLGTDLVTPLSHPSTFKIKDQEIVKNEPPRHEYALLAA